MTTSISSSPIQQIDLFKDRSAVEDTSSSSTTSAKPSSQKLEDISKLVDQIYFLVEQELVKQDLSASASNNIPSLRQPTSSPSKKVIDEMRSFIEVQLQNPNDSKAVNTKNIDAFLNQVTSQNKTQSLTTLMSDVDNFLEYKQPLDPRKYTHDIAKLVLLMSFTMLKAKAINNESKVIFSKIVMQAALTQAASTIARGEKALTEGIMSAAITGGTAGLGAASNFKSAHIRNQNTKVLNTNNASLKTTNEKISQQQNEMMKLENEFINSRNPLASKKSELTAEYALRKNSLDQNDQQALAALDNEYIGQNGQITTIDKQLTDLEADYQQKLANGPQIELNTLTPQRDLLATENDRLQGIEEKNIAKSENYSGIGTTLNTVGQLGGNLTHAVYQPQYAIDDSTKQLAETAERISGDVEKKESEAAQNAADMLRSLLEAFAETMRTLEQNKSAIARALSA